MRSVPLFSVTCIVLGSFYESRQLLLANNLISTVVGTGSPGFAGDGSFATSAKVNNPTGITSFDTNGNYYFADTYNNRVRMVSSSGIISTIAGTGAQGFSGDGGSAQNAKLFYPTGVTLDGNGKLYIADSYNHRVRVVDLATNIISTVIGSSSEKGYSGDGGKPMNARLNTPSAVLISSNGLIYISDTYNNVIREVNTVSNIITSIAGSGSCGFSGDGGLATNANLCQPIGLAEDSLGNLFVADAHNNRIRKISTSGYIRTYAGDDRFQYSGDGGTATHASLYYPTSILFDNKDNLYIADSGNDAVRLVIPTGIISTVAGNGNRGYSGDGGVASSSQLYYPSGIAMDDIGNLYISDSSNHRIRRI